MGYGLVFAALLVAAPAGALVVHVGPARDIRTLAHAARYARSGDVVEVDAGRYFDDGAVWDQDTLVIRAVNGRVRVEAGARVPEDKAIFVVRGRDVTIEGFEFAGAHVPDGNGAGIRHERGRLVVRDCLFEDNEMGLLAGNDAQAELVVERSEFRGNAVAPALQAAHGVGHQIYVSAIGRFTLRESYVHHGAAGHLVKSRARESIIEYNRLTDEAGGHASYELEFPDGGIALVVGNLIGQSATTENATIVSFGAESWRWPDNRLYLVHNTIVDGLPRGGVVLHVAEGATAVDVLNNVVVGNALVKPRAPGRFSGNRTAAAPDFAAPAAGDYRLHAASRVAAEVSDPGTTPAGQALRPAREYVHPRASRPVEGEGLRAGAFQDVVP